MLCSRFAVTLFADGDYRITGKMEKYFQNSIYLIFKMMGFYVDVERTTSRGRVDIGMRHAALRSGR